MWWEQLLARRWKWQYFSELEDAPSEAKAGTPWQQHPWSSSSGPPGCRWMTVRMRMLSLAASQMKGSAVRHWPSREPRREESIPGWKTPSWCWNDANVRGERRKERKQKGLLRVFSQFDETQQQLSHKKVSVRFCLFTRQRQHANIHFPARSSCSLTRSLHKCVFLRVSCTNPFPTARRLGDYPPPEELCRLAPCSWCWRETLRTPAAFMYGTDIPKPHRYYH